MMLCYRRLIDDDQAAQLRIVVSRPRVILSEGCPFDFAQGRHRRGINAGRFSYSPSKALFCHSWDDSGAGTGAVSIASTRPAPFAVPHEPRGRGSCGTDIESVSTAGGRVTAMPSIARYLRSSSVSISTCGRPSSRSLIRVPISFMWSVLRWLSNDAWSW